MEWTDIEIRPCAPGGHGFEAEIRGDTLVSGDRGRWISVVGWGGTEEAAREQLAMALRNVRLMRCELCQDKLWVCEAHDTEPSGHCGGAGKPCPDCNDGLQRGLGLDVVDTVAEDSALNGP